MPCFSPNLNVKALYAAPFFNTRSSGPADGMERSYQEILRILERLGRDAEGFAFRGSTSYLPAKGEPVHSAAAEDLIAKALAQQGKPLYVLTIGAITNVASALLLEPRIADRIVIVWLGGHPTYWEHTREFNLMQDVPAAQVVFDSGAPLVQIPCINVAEHLRTTLPGGGALCQGARRHRRLPVRDLPGLPRRPLCLFARHLGHQHCGVHEPARLGSHAARAFADFAR